MKKRILSAILALSMIFSVIPIIPSTSALADNASIADIKCEFDADGKINKDSIQLKPGDQLGDGEHTVSFIVMFDVSNISVSCDGDDLISNGFIEAGNSRFVEGSDDIAADSGYTADDFSGTEYPLVYFYGTITVKEDEGDDKEFRKLNVSTIAKHDALGAQAFADWLGSQWGSLDDGTQYEISFNGGTPSTVSSVADIKALGDIPVIIIVCDDETGKSRPSYLYTTSAKSGETPTDPPAQDKVIDTITADIDALQLGTVAPTKATNVEVSSNGDSASVGDVNFASGFTNLRADNKPAAGTGDHVATFTVTAPSGYKFDAGSEPTVTISGYTAKVTSIAADGSTATVEVKKAQEAKKVTSITVNEKVWPTTTLGNNIAANDLDNLKVTINYNDGSTDGPIAYSNFSGKNLSVVYSDTDPSSNISTNPFSWSPTITKKTTNLYVKYAGSDIDTSVATGGVLYAAVGGIGLEDEELTAASVTFAYPVVGTANTTTATPADANKYSVDSISWNNTSNPTYGETVKATVVLSPEEGYAFKTTGNISVTATDGGSANSLKGTIANNVVQVATKDDGTVEAVFTFTMPAGPTISSATSDWDFYNNAGQGNDIVIVLDKAVDSIGTVKVGGTAVTATLGADKKTITIDKAAFGGTIANKTTLTKAGTAKAVTVAIPGLATDLSTNVTVKDTTPYLTLTTNTTATFTPYITNGTKKGLQKGTTTTITASNPPAHFKDYTWSSSLNGTGTTTANNANSSATSYVLDVPANPSADITATLNANVYSGVTVTLAAGTANSGTWSATPFTVTKGGTNVSLTKSGNNYTFTAYGDETYSVTATADAHSYISTAAGATLSTKNSTDNSLTISNISANTTYNYVATKRIAPTITPTSGTYRKESGDSTARSFTITPNDYTVTGVTTSSGAPAGTLSSNVYTISNANLEGANVGDYTYTLTCSEGTLSPAVTYSLKVQGSIEVTAVTAPTGPFVHGDLYNLKGLSFTYTDNGDTYVFTSANGTDITATKNGTALSTADVTAALANVKFAISGTGKTVAATDWNSFKTALASVTTRHDTTKTTTINQGQTIVVSVQSKNRSATITVGKKAIVLTAATVGNDGKNKKYDGTATTTADQNTAIKNALAVKNATGNTLAPDDTFSNSIFTITGTYKNASNVNQSDVNASGWNIVVSETHATNGWAGDNYTFTVENLTGNIEKRPIRITALNTNVHAKEGDNNYLTATSTNATLTANAATTTLADLTGAVTTGTNHIAHSVTLSTATGHYNPVGALAITYKYKFSNVTSGDTVDNNVIISDVSCADNNYDVKLYAAGADATQLTAQKGYVEKREISSISVNPATGTYYYSDKVDPTDYTVTLTYTGGGTATYNLGNLPSSVSVKWSDNSVFNKDSELTVNQHNGKKIVISSVDKSTAKAEIAITVLPIPITTTATANGNGGIVVHTYDGSKYKTVADGDITFAKPSLNTAKLTGTQYSNKVAADISAVAFGSTKQVEFDSATADESNPNRPVTIRATNLTLTMNGGVSASNYVLADVDNLKGRIDKRPLTITTVKNITMVDENSTTLTGSMTGVSCKNAVVAGDYTNAFAVVDNTGNAGIVGSDTVTINFDYEYANSVYPVPDTTPDKGRKDDVTVKNNTNLKISAGSTNYKIANTSDITGSGHIRQRIFSNMTISGPTKTSYDYAGTDTKLDLAGLTVTLQYVYTGGAPAGNDYYLVKADGTWQVTQGSGSSQTVTDVAIADLPFTYTWDGTATTPAQNDYIDRQASSLGTNGKKINVVFTKDTSKTGQSANISVVKRPITFIVNASDYTKNKTYDGNANVTLGSNVGVTVDSTTSATNKGLGTGDTATNINVKVNSATYDNKNKGTGKTITFGYDTAQLGAKAVNYDIKIADGTGDIAAKEIKITEVHYMPAINQYASTTRVTNNSITATAASGTNAYVVFDSSKAPISSETPTIQVAATYTAPNVKTEADKATLSLQTGDYVSLANNAVSNNYTLDTAGVKITGTVNEVKPTKIEILNGLAVLTEKEYGDYLNMNGLQVKVHSGIAYADTYVYVAASKTWTKGTETGIAYADLPFTLAWSGAFGTPTSPDKTVDSDTKNGGVLTTKGTYTLTATLKDPAATATATDKSATATQSVIARKVKVTAEAIANIEKTYDGTVSYSSTVSNNTQGGIGYTVEAVTPSTLDQSITLPKVNAATVQFNNKNCASANKVTISSLTLTDTTNFNNTAYTTEINDDPSGRRVQIKKRDITLSAITNVPAIDQYAPMSKKTDGTATSAAGAIFAAANNTATPPTGIVGTETVYIKYSYQHDKNDDPSMTTSVTLSDIAFDNDTTAKSNANSNYNLAATPTSAQADINGRNITISVTTNPTQVQQGTGTGKYNDALNLAGMVVTVVNAPSSGTGTTTTDVYTASGSAGAITWTKATNNGVAGSIAAAALPFTLQLDGNDISTTDNSSTKLRVDLHNGKKFKAVLSTATTTNEGAPIQVLPIEITSITTASKDNAAITKTYDGNKNLVGATIVYSSSDVLDADKNAVELTAAAAYASKDVVVSGGNKVQFTNPAFVSGKNYNGNYKLASTVTINDLNASITEKTVNVDYVYVQSTTAQLNAQTPTHDKVFDVTGASATGTLLTNDYSRASDRSVVINSTDGFVSGEANKYTFNYSVKYVGTVRNVNSDTKVSVTVTPDSTPVATSDAANCPLSNYNFTWNLLAQEGWVSANEPSEIEIISGPAQTQYTHGDALNLSGLSFKIKYTNGADTTYTVTGTSSADYAWDVAIPSGISVSIGGVDLSTNAALRDNAHHLKMDGEKVTVKVDAISGANGTKTAGNAFEVSKKPLTIEVTMTGDPAKIYNNSTNVPSTATITFGIKDATTALATFNSVQDTVGASADVAYVDKNVAYEANGTTVATKKIQISNQALTNTDAGNYTISEATPFAGATGTTLNADNTLNGKINPFVLKVTAIGDSIPDATRGDFDATPAGTTKKTVTGQTTTDYTIDPAGSSAATVPDASKPTLTYDYQYQDVSSITTNATVKILNPSVADKNYLLDPDIADKTGRVTSQSATGIAIVKQPKLGSADYDGNEYVYGDKPNFTGANGVMTVEITYGDGSKEQVEYGSAVWNNLGLKIADDSAIKADTVLRTTNTNNKVKVSYGTLSAESAAFTVLKRRVYVDVTSYDAADQSQTADIEKTYDGNVNVVGQKINNAQIAANQTVGSVTYNGLYDDDTAATLSKTNDIVYQYTSANTGIGTSQKVTYSDSVQLTGIDANKDQYTLVFEELTGTIKAKVIKVTPVANELKTKYENPDATADLNLVTSPATLNTLNTTYLKFEPAETISGVTFQYTVTAGVNDVKKAGTYSYTAAAASGTDANVSVAIDPTNRTYSWKVAGNDNGCYEFQWQPAEVVIKGDDIRSFKIVNVPIVMRTGSSRKTHYYGDSLDLTGLTVEIEKSSGTVRVEWSNTDNSEWKKYGLGVPKLTTGQSNFSGTEATIEQGGSITGLETGNNGSQIQVKISPAPTQQSSQTVTSKTTLGTLRVDKREVQLTNSATQLELTREYDSTSYVNAAGVTALTNKMSYQNAGAANDPLTGMTISYGTISAKYYEGENADPHQNENKTVKLDNVAATIKDGEKNVTAQYDIKQPDALTGAITPYEIHVEPDDSSVPPIGQKKNADDAYLTQTITPIYGRPILSADSSTVSVTLTGKYPDANITPGSPTPGYEEKTITGITMTENNNDKGDYKFILDRDNAPGRVVNPSISSIVIDKMPQLVYTHGDKLNLKDMSMTVATHSEEEVAIEGTYTIARDETTGKWTVTNVDPSATGDAQKIWIAGVGHSSFENDAEIIELLDLHFFAVNGSTSQPLDDNKVLKNLRRDSHDGLTFTVRGGSTTATTSEPAKLTVNKAKITQINADGITGQAITKIYDTTTVISDADQQKIAYTISDSSEKKFTDDVKIVIKVDGAGDPMKPATYKYKDVQYNGTTVTYMPIEIDITKLDVGGTDKANYEIASDAYLTNSVNGTITKKDLTITITDGPQVFVGMPATKELETSLYSVTGYAGSETAADINLKVYGTYTNGTDTATDSAAVTYEAEYKDGPDKGNYNVSVEGNPLGKVTNNPIRAISIKAQPTREYVHGDLPDLTGMEVEIIFDDAPNDDDDTRKTYKYDADQGWIDKATNSPATPEFKLMWGAKTSNDDTAPAATSNEVDLDDPISLANTGTEGAKAKGLSNTSLESDTAKRTTKITAVATIKNSLDPDTNDYVSAETEEISVAKKQLTIEIGGKASKIYDASDSCANANTDTLTFNLKGANLGDVSLDKEETLKNTKFAQSDVTKPNVVTLKHPAMVFNKIALASDDPEATSYYIAPSGNKITNESEGIITERTIKITGIRDSLNTSTGASQTGTITIGFAANEAATTGYDLFEDSSNPPTYYPLAGSDNVQVTIPYKYDLAAGQSMNDELENISVLFNYDPTNTPMTWDDDNYIVEIDVSKTANISSGVVKGIEISGTSKTEYTHGEKFELDGTVVKLIYDGDTATTPKYDEYKYNSDTHKWDIYKNGSSTPSVTDKDLPSDITLTIGTGSVNANPTVDTDTPANDTRTALSLKTHGDGNKLIATHSKQGVNPAEGPEIKVNKIKVTITVNNKAGENIEQNYNKKKGLSDDNFDKLDIDDDLDDVKLAGEDVSITNATLAAGTAKANFASENVAYDDSTPAQVTTMGITANPDYYVLDGDDADNYEIVFDNSAIGKIMPKTLNVVITVPSTTQGSDGVVADKTGVAKAAQGKEGYYTEDLENGDTVTLAYQKVKYADTSTTGATTNFDITDADYKVKIDGGAQQGNYTLGTVSYSGEVKKLSGIVIIKEPDKTDYKSGDKLDLTGLTVKIGNIKEVEWDSQEWTDLGLEIISPDSDPAIDHDSVLKVKNNNDTLKVKMDEDETNESVTITVSKRKVLVVPDGNPDVKKPYDGESDVTTNFTVKIADDQPDGYDDLLPDDKTKIAEDRDPISTGAGFKYTDGTSDQKDANDNTGDSKYTVVPKDKLTLETPGLDGEYELVFTDNLKGVINKKQITPVIRDAGITTAGPATVPRANVPFNETPNKNNTFTINGLTPEEIALIKADGVKIKYSATYPDLTVGDDKALTLDTYAVDGTNAKNYEIVDPTATGSVTQASSPGGGGGGGNRLDIHYELEDGKAGADVSVIEVVLGAKPEDLIGVFKSKLKDPTVLWTTSDENIATVDENGIVTFVGAGEAIITATSKQNKQLKDTVKIIVAAPTPTPAPTEKPKESLITKTMLNPYIVGYDDYVFGPELPISREELAAIFARLIANNLYMDKDYDTSFPDVPEKWSKTYIGYLEGFNVVTGYEDGTFKPENYITRAEMAVMMAKAEGYDITPNIRADEAGFPDVDAGYATWSAAKAIQVLSELGIMEGYTDGTFRPGRPITRAETVATVNRVLATQEVKTFEVLPSDVTDAHWAYNDIVFAMNHRVLKDAAADPNTFIWSEQFDKNMVTITEKVPGGSSQSDGKEEDNSSSAADDANKDAIAPNEETEPTDTDKPTTN